MNDQEEALRAWSLKRRCTVAPRQFVTSSLAILSGSLLIALVFTLLGYWIISVCFLLEMTGVSAALLWFARHAIDGERLWLYDDGRLVVEVVNGTHHSRHSFNAAWVRLDIAGARSGQLSLSQGRLKINLGKHVPAAERRAFCREFQRYQRMAAAPSPQLPAR